MELTEAVAKKVLETVDAGLVHGMGEPVPGKMCVEAAVCFALGLPHGDDPPCVGRAVRAFKIKINDSRWSSDEARAKGMRRVAIAQLGSDQIDQVAFAKIVAEETIRQIVPIALRAAASLNPKKADVLEAAAIRCEKEGTREAARNARSAADAAADAYAYAYAAAAAAADAYAYAYAYAAAAAAADAAAYAYAYAAAAAAAAADADAYAYADAAAKDRVLSLAANIAVNALIKLGSTGAQWLGLCE
jgi:hypothetical protein